MEYTKQNGTEAGTGIETGSGSGRDEDEDEARIGDKKRELNEVDEMK
jgi:hypothetical protein